MHHDTLTMKVTKNSYQSNFNVGFEISLVIIYYALSCVIFFYFCVIYLFTCLNAMIYNSNCVHF